MNRRLSLDITLYLGFYASTSLYRWSAVDRRTSNRRSVDNHNFSVFAKVGKIVRRITRKKKKEQRPHCGGDICRTALRSSATERTASIRSRSRKQNRIDCRSPSVAQRPRGTVERSDGTSRSSSASFGNHWPRTGRGGGHYRGYCGNEIPLSPAIDRRSTVWGRSSLATRATMFLAVAAKADRFQTHSRYHRCLCIIIPYRLRRRSAASRRNVPS